MFGAFFAFSALTMLISQQTSKAYGLVNLKPLWAPRWKIQVGPSVLKSAHEIFVVKKSKKENCQYSIIPSNSSLSGFANYFTVCSYIKSDFSLDITTVG